MPHPLLPTPQPSQALIDRPDETRRQINFKRLALTDFKVDIPRLANKTVLKKALAESGAFDKFAATAWGKKLAARAAKAGMTDLDRYKAAVARKTRSSAIKAKLAK